MRKLIPWRRLSALIIPGVCLLCGLLMAGIIDVIPRFVIILWFITLLAIVILLLFGLIMEDLLKKTSSGSGGLLRRRNMILKIKQEAAQDCVDLIDKCKKTLKRIHIFSILVMILLMLNLILSGIIIISGGIWPLAVLSAIIAWSSLYGILEMMMQSSDDDLPGHTLDEKIFPEFTELINKAAEESELDFELQPYLVTGSTIDIYQGRDALILKIGVEPLSVLTKNEMYAVLLHEIADVMNGDTEINDMYHVDLARFRHVPLIIGKLGIIIMAYLKSRLIFSWDIYRNCTAAFRELRSDLAVDEWGWGGPLLDALAKMHIFKLYMQEPNELFNLYNANKPHEHFQTMLINNYKEMLIKRRNEWNTMLGNELPALILQHATFAKRRTALGDREYSFLAEEYNEKYIMEQMRVINLGDEMYCRSLSRNYEKMRENNYVKPLEYLEHYEEQQKNGGTFTLEEMKAAAGAYEKLYEYESALEIYNRIYDIYAQEISAWALLQIGKIQLKLYDDHGIENIKKAIQEAAQNEPMDSYQTIVDEGMNMIGHYCLKMGLREELRTYRQNIVHYYSLCPYDESPQCAVQLDNLLI